MTTGCIKHPHLRIGILIVAFNAESTLSQVLDRIPHAFVSDVAAVLICDDASNDNTYATAVSCKQDYPQLPIHILRQVSRRGYGGNQKTGYAWAEKLGLDAVILLHADAQYAPELLPEIIAPIVSGTADAVFGSRMMVSGTARLGGMPRHKYFGNRILTFFQNALAGVSLSEWHSGYRAYSMQTLKRLGVQNNSDDFDFDTQIILQLIKSEARIKEIAIPTYYGDEISHVNGVKYAFQVLRETFHFRISQMGFGRSRYRPECVTYSIKNFSDSSHALILQALSQRSALRILDLGCADDFLGAKIRALGHTVIGIDAAASRHGGEPTDIIRADLDNGLPISLRGLFDVVICADILEHLKNPERTLQQLHQAIPVNGKLIVSIPNFGHWYPRVRSTLGRFDYDQKGILDFTHLRFFTKRSFEQMALRTGYDVVLLNCTSTPLRQLWSGKGKFRSIVVSILSTLDRNIIKMRPQLFAYQFIYQLTPQRGARHLNDVTAQS